MTATLSAMSAPRDTSARIRAEIAAQDRDVTAVYEAARIPRGRWYSHMKNPRLWRAEDVAAIARVLGVPVTDLLGDEVTR